MTTSETPPRPEELNRYDSQTPVSGSLQQPRGGIPGLSPHMQTFGTCVCFHFIVPLFPFVIELMQDHKLSPTTLCVGGAVYVMALGASSRNQLIFSISFVLSLLYTALFALVKTNNPTSLTHTPRLVGYSVLVIVVCVVIERFNRHVIERAPYLEFIKE